MIRMLKLQVLIARGKLERLKMRIEKIIRSVHPVIYILGVMILLPFLITRDPLKPEMKSCAKSHGLEDVVFKPDRLIGKDGHYEYIVKSSNFSDLSYDEMLAVAQAIEEIDWSVVIRYYECDGDVYRFDLHSRSIIMNGEEIYTDYYNSDKYKAEERIRTRYIDEYPFVGMGEEYLEYTILGKPDSIELCKDYSALRPERRSIEYEWEATKDHGWYSVTVHDGEVTFITYSQNGKIHSKYIGKDD